VTKFIFLVFISTGIVLHAQTPDCKKWKNGTFITYPVVGQPYYIIRKGSKQMEFNSSTNTWEELVVRWLDPCTYELSRRKKVSKRNKSHPGIIFTVSIMDTYEKHCLVFIISNLPGDVGYFDCMYLGPADQKFSIAP
jgi:hypothetical protein